MIIIEYLSNSIIVMSLVKLIFVCFYFLFMHGRQIGNREREREADDYDAPHSDLCGRKWHFYANRSGGYLKCNVSFSIRRQK